jgi:prophage tail gpP-like protein
MFRAVPGSPYTVKPGDTLIGISKQAYGRANKWKDIFTANQTVLRSGDPNLIYPGETITIPLDEVAVDAKIDLLGALGLPTLTGKDKDDFTVVVEGEELVVSAGRVKRSIDTAADGWTASMLWNPDNEDISGSLIPYGYQKASCYLGGTLSVDGLIYNMKNRLSTNGIFKDLEGFSFTADIVDSTIKPPYEQENITLELRARQLVEPLGIRVKWQVIDVDLPFDRVTAKPEDTIFSHLSKLASQRGVLVSSTPLGELLLTKAATGRPVGTIEEDFPPGTNLEISFNGRERFNVYKAIAQSPGRKSKLKKFTKTAVAKDDVVPKSRFLTFSADESTAGDIQKAADWRRSKQVADSLTMPFPVNTWYDPNGNLWRENTLVTVVSKSLQVPDGFTFLIKAVEYVFESTGTKAVLSLVPPQVYTGRPLIEPWGNPGSGWLDKLVDSI